MEVRHSKPWDWFKNEEEGGWPREGAITPWHGSVPSLSRLRRDIDRIFGEVLHAPGRQRQDHAAESMLRPYIDIYSTDSEYRITVEVPGVTEEDLRLEIADGILMIGGEKKQERIGQGNRQCSECVYGAFERVLTLPSDAIADKIDASFRDGVLTVAIPRRKTAKAAPRQVPIKRAA